MDAVAKVHGVDPNRYVIVNGTMDAPQFSLEREQYLALSQVVRRVVHCAAMVNLAIGRQEMLDWSARGITTGEAAIYNLIPDQRVTPTQPAPVAAQEWPVKVTLEPGIAGVISEFPDTLRAGAAFETAQARAAWARVSDRGFETLCDAQTLLARRAETYQGEPALTSKSDMVSARAASLAK